MTAAYRRVYNLAPAPARVALIVIGDLWYALTLGTRLHR